MTRKTLNFTDSDNIQHAIPAYRVLDVRLGADNKATVVLSGNESYQVTSPSYTELVLAYNSLPDNTQAYLG